MFVVYQVSLELIAELRSVVLAAKRMDRDLADQLTRAASSVALNIAEGNGRSGGDRRRCFEIAQGSAREVKAVLDVGVAWGWLEPRAAAAAKADRLVGMLWGLTHGARASPKS